MEVTGLVEPPYTYYSLEAFYAFLALLHAQKHSQIKINKQNKNKVTLSIKFFAHTNFEEDKSHLFYFSLTYINI